MIRIISKIIKMSFSVLVIFAIIAALSIAAPIAAQETDGSTATADSSAQVASPRFNFDTLQGEGSINMGKTVGKMIGYLLLVIIMILGLVYFLKRFVYNRKDVLGKNSAIRILSSTYVAQKKSLLLVEVLDKLLILSVTDNNMNFVTELSREEYNAYINKYKDRESGDRTAGVQFGDVLNRIFKRTK